MKLTLVIDGPSAEDLFAVGPTDLREHFLKEYLHVDPRDVKKCYFSECDDIESKMRGSSYIITTHKENYNRDERVFV
jgi:hypothetical protein